MKKNKDNLNFKQVTVLSALVQNLLLLQHEGGENNYPFFLGFSVMWMIYYLAGGRGNPCNHSYMPSHLQMY